MNQEVGQSQEIKKNLIPILMGIALKPTCPILYSTYNNQNYLLHFKSATNQFTVVKYLKYLQEKCSHVQIIIIETFEVIFLVVVVKCHPNAHFL